MTGGFDMTRHPGLVWVGFAAALACAITTMALFVSTLRLSMEQGDAVRQGQQGGVARPAPWPPSPASQTARPRP